MQATPLQMANVASAVINGGTLYRPQIVKEIRSPYGKTLKTFEPDVIRHIPVTQDALRYVREGMWLKGAMALTDSLQGRTAGIIGAGRIGRAGRCGGHDRGLADARVRDWIHRRGRV